MKRLKNWLRDVLQPNVVINNVIECNHEIAPKEPQPILNYDLNVLANGRRLDGVQKAEVTPREVRYVFLKPEDELTSPIEAVE